LLKVNSLFTDTESALLVIAGDFNCNVRSRYYPMLRQLANDNDLVQCDLKSFADDLHTAGIMVFICLGLIMFYVASMWIG
jgi:hypothetical protein